MATGDEGVEFHVIKKMAASEEVTTSADPGASGGAEAVSDPRCVFCRIVAKEEQAPIVYEDADYVCFRDRSPSATHHYLLVPRTHIRWACV